MISTCHVTSYFTNCLVTQDLSKTHMGSVRFVHRCAPLHGLLVGMTKLRAIGGTEPDSLIIRTPRSAKSSPPDDCESPNKILMSLLDFRRRDARRKLDITRDIKSACTVIAQTIGSIT